MRRAVSDWNHNPAGQVGFLVAELHHAGLWNKVCDASDAGRAAAIFARRFERPRILGLARRTALARTIYRELEDRRVR
jgi:hypothetical protein